jgi:hypothetical protein
LAPASRPHPLDCAAEGEAIDDTKKRARQDP